MVSWTTQSKLSHSLLGFVSTAATLHAATLIILGGGLGAFASLGLAAASGILAKYNYFFALAALAPAVAVVPEARRAFKRREVLVAPALALALTLPHFLWALDNLAQVTERARALLQAGGPRGIELPGTTVLYGVLSLVLCVALSILPGLAVWGAAHLFDRHGAAAARAAPPPHSASVMRRVVGLVLLGELITFSIVVLAAGYTRVHERYLLVLLAPVGLWLALRFPLKARPRAAVVVLCVAILTALSVTVRRPVSVARGGSRLTFPYAGMARAIGAQVPRPFAVLGDRHENSANIALLLPGVTIFDPRAPADLVLVVANTTARAIEAGGRLGPAYAPESAIRLIEQPDPVGPTSTAVLAVQLWRRRFPPEAR